MTHIRRFRCTVCDRDADPPRSAATCAHCAKAGDPFAILEIEFDLAAAARTLTRESLANRPRSHWRYAELLPIDVTESAAAWPVGWTPIVDAPRLARWAGVRRLRLKDDGRNPTASFKDRASSVGVAHAVALGAARVACASTGNAASSLAGHAAMAGLPATIFVPERAPEPKVVQLLAFGADVRRVRGSYAQAWELCQRECAANGWYNRNSAVNPYLVEGKKTCGLEIAEQTNGDAADWVAVGVGDGCTIAGIGKGLREMAALGLATRAPRLLGAQAAGVAPVADAFDRGSPPASQGGTTIADSIDVLVPRNWRKAVHRVRESGGAFARVADREIEEAMLACARLAGVFAEPAAAAAVAGVKRAVADGAIDRDADVLAVITGSGLKDVKTAMRIAGRPVDVDP